MLSHVVSMFCLAFALVGALVPAAALAVGGAFDRWYAFSAPALSACPVRAPALAAWRVVLADIDAAATRPVVCAPQCASVARFRRPSPRGMAWLDAQARMTVCAPLAPRPAPLAPRIRDARGRFSRAA